MPSRVDRASTSADDLKTIADRIVGSRRTFVIGVGANYALAQNVTVLGSTGNFGTDVSYPAAHTATSAASSRSIRLTFAPARSMAFALSRPMPDAAPLLVTGCEP